MLCKVVPILVQGIFNDETIKAGIDAVYESSKVWPGAEAEGIIIYHTASASMFKKTLRNDEKPKGKE